MIRHTRQSEHNHDAQEYLSKNPQYEDRGITTLFYSALHIVDAYPVSKGKRPRGHWARNTAVQKELEPVTEDYHNLYALCMKARYVVDFDQLTKSERDAAIQWHKSVCGYVQNRMP